MAGRHRKVSPDEVLAFYASLPPDKRSRRAIAEHFSVATSTAAEWVWKYGLVEKVRQIEEKAAQAALAEVEETAEAAAKRHLQYAREVQEKAMRVLREQDPVCFPEALKALSEAIRWERQARGEPDRRCEARLEVTLRENFERWLEAPGSTGAQRIEVLNGDGEVVDAEIVGGQLALPSGDDDDEDFDDGDEDDDA